MIDRFSNRSLIKVFPTKNTVDYFKTRDKNIINQYDTPVFKYPTEDQLERISFIEHYWSAGDRLYKLARRYYGDEKDWWIILRFNKIGSEVSIKLGDLIKVPVPIEDVAGYFL